MTKRLLSEIPMLGFGAGVAVAGASLAFIGASGIKDKFYPATLLMGVGTWATYFGSQVAIGAIERARGLQ